MASLVADTPDTATAETPKKTADGTEEREFGRYRELPMELKYMIWEAALPGPRVIPLTPLSWWTDEDGMSWLHIYSNNELEKLVLVCKEAKFIVLKNYQKYILKMDETRDSLDQSLSHSWNANLMAELKPPDKPYLFIDYNIDTVYCCHWGKYEKLQRDCLLLAKHMAWQPSYFGSSLFTWEEPREICKTMETATIVDARLWGAHNRPMEEVILIYIPNSLRTWTELPPDS